MIHNQELYFFMWLNMRSSILCLMAMLFLAPVTSAEYDCEDLPNVYTVEDINAIEVHCENATLLASKIYPSATWIIHDYKGSVKHGTSSSWLTRMSGKVLRNICIVWLGGKGSAYADKKFQSASGNCGGSYPIDYADDYNFIDITDAVNDKKEPFNHSLVQDGKEVLNDDPYILLVRTANDMTANMDPVFTGYQAGTNIEQNDQSKNKYEKRVFGHNSKSVGQFVQCPGWGIRNCTQLKACSSIVGPMFYDKSFYEMEAIDVEKRPYHHGCFTVENHDSLTDLKFLDNLKTGSDYVDKCIGKFANVVRNNPLLCPDPRRYYASMDPDPESLIRTTYLNSEWNKKGNLEVKVEFPEGKTFECVNECEVNIVDANATVDPKGLYEFPCKILTGNVTLTKEYKETQSPRILQYIREIKGKLTINTDVDRDVLPQLRFVGGPNVKAPALELTLNGHDGYDPVLPMRLTKVTAELGDKKPVLLWHSMRQEDIPPNLIADLVRSAGGKDKIQYLPISQKPLFF